MFGKLRAWFGDLSGPKKLLATTVAAAAGIGTVVATANGSIQLYESLTEDARMASRLEFVDVSFVSNEKLDIKLQNNGGSTAFITRADLRVKKIWTFVRPFECTGGEAHFYSDVSHVYEIKLPTSDAPYKVSESLSQTLEAGAVDRFQIHLLEPTDVRPGTDYALLATLSLVYDSDDKVLAEDLLFAYPGKDIFSYDSDKVGDSCRDGLGEYQLRRGLDESDAARLSSENEEKMEEVRKLNAIQNGYLNKLMRIVS